MKKLLILPFFFISLTSLAQTRLTIQSPSEKCATVKSNSSVTPNGDLGIWAGRVRTPTPFLIIRSFFQFDLSSIPVGSFVNWARLSLFSVGSDSGSNACLLRRVTSPWDPATVIWRDQPRTTKLGTIHLSMSTSKTEDYKNINVTNLVQTMVDSPATSFGFVLRLDIEEHGNADAAMIFFSPGYNKPHYNPKLVMEYTAPGLQQKVTTISKGLDGTSTEMNIYPNPCNGIFNCNIKSASTNNMNLRVIDMLGRTVYRQPVNTSSLLMRVNLPSSSAGTYFVILQDNKNATIVSQQLQVN